MSKKLWIMLLVGMAMFLMSGCGKTTVKLDDYVIITTEGYDTRGTATFEFDYDSFEIDYAGKIKGKNNDQIKQMGLLNGESVEKLLISQCVSMELDKTSDLSNGDEITLKWDCDELMAEEYFGVEFEYSDIKYEVNDLVDMERFNPFEHITIEYRGIAPSAAASIIVDDEDEIMPHVKFEYEQKYTLDNGEIFKVRAYISGTDDVIYEDKNIVLSPYEKEYKVEGLPILVQSYEDISEEALEEMKKTAEKAYIKHAEEYWCDYEKLQSFTYVGNYFTDKPQSIISNAKNALYLVYRCEVLFKDTPVTYYYFCDCNNITIESDGSGKLHSMRTREPSNKYRPEGISGFYYGYGSIEEVYGDFNGWYGDKILDNIEEEFKQ